MLLFFSTIIIINILIAVIILLSNFKVKIENLQVYYSDKYSNIDYNIKIGLYFCNKVPILQFKLNKNDKSKIFSNEEIQTKLKKIIGNINTNKKIQIKDVIPQLKIAKNYLNIEKLKFHLNIDTEDVIFTSYLVGILSIVISNILNKSIRRYNKKNYWYRIQPIYKKQNYIKLNFNSIISIKIVHIISMSKKMGGSKHERASNRRFNVNCYGKY